MTTHEAHVRGLNTLANLRSAAGRQELARQNKLPIPRKKQQPA